jgi:hypothetical protein
MFTFQAPFIPESADGMGKDGDSGKRDDTDRAKVAPRPCKSAKFAYN